MILVDVLLFKDPNPDPGHRKVQDPLDPDPDPQHCSEESTMNKSYDSFWCAMNCFLSLVR